MEQLHEFWVLVADVWRTGVYGIDIGRILTAFAIFFPFLLLRRLLAGIVSGRLRAIVRRTPTDLDDSFIDAIDKPLGFVPVVIGLFFAVDYLQLQGVYDEAAQNLLRSLIAFTIFWAFYRAIEPLSALTRKLENVVTPIMVEWLIKAIRLVVFLIGLASILEIWGIQVGPIIAGLGLFGVAVALGAQDLFKNLISGILIIAEKRFSNGDWIRVDGVVEGTVESIGFRSTVVRRFDKAPVYVPNAKLSDTAVTNFTAMTHRRIYWKIGVEYSTSVEQLRTVRDAIEDYVLGSDDFAHPPEVSTFVRIDAFNDSSIDIMLYCFTKTTNWGEWLEIKERLAYAIKDIVEGAGSGFAFPSQSVYVESLPGTAPEAFTPPKEDQE